MGSYRAGFSTIPASMAAWGKVSLAAVVPKYRCAAASMPTAWFPANVP